MNKRTLKKIGGTVLAIFLILGIVLGAHIYMVTRVKAPSEHTRVMARVDFNQGLNEDDAAKITLWLYQQKGIDHVLVNPKSRIAVFTYYPVKTNANDIVSGLKTSLNYKKAVRYILTEADLRSGCPAAATSFSYKVYNSIKHIF
jgi:hypothetical protein